MAELQDPTSTAPNALCIYDAGAQMIATASVPPNSTKWVFRGGKRFRFNDGFAILREHGADGAAPSIAT